MAVWGAESGDIEVSVPEDVAVVTLARPDKLNALTAAMRRELAAIFRYFGDGHSVRGIVVTGTGRAFSAGMDLREAADLPPGGLIADLESFHDMTRAVLETRVPVVGALNGIAVGGACELTLCFDARLGTSAAEYFLPENSLGLTISNASSVLLSRLAGPRAALRLVLASPRIGAREALDLGLLDEIVDPDGLIEAATGLVHRWTPPGAATAVHLPLLRPSRAVVEQAMAAETEAASVPDAAGLAQAGISRFLRRGEGG
jgi:enoyl-CoA hydratase/carnithine racemase